VFAVGLIGYDGGEIARRGLADFAVVVNSSDIPRIQDGPHLAKCPKPQYAGNISRVTARCRYRPASGGLWRGRERLPSGAQTPAPGEGTGGRSKKLQGVARNVNASGIPLQSSYESAGSNGLRTSPPGRYPFTRGIRADMYRKRFWTMRQYAGFATAAESNARYRYLLGQGTTGLSVAFDLVTQLGYDSDSLQARGEVGKVGVAIDSIDDVETLFAEIPLDAVTVSMTINAPAAILLAFVLAVARRRGIPFDKLGGTIQNDVLKEYVARGTYIFPPTPSMRLVTDVMAYCAEQVPQWNTISISGYHIREAGSTALQEIAFTLANAKAYLRAAARAGLGVDVVAPRISFFWNAHNDLFEEVAKYRAARALWAEIVRDEFGSHDARSQMLRFHTQTGGSTLTAQEPENNVVRVTLQALAAVLGGTQSLHTNGADEALGLPTADAARVALRTQQIIAYESGVTDVTDPLGGSYYVEALTADLIGRARELIAEIDGMGGAVAAVENGWMQEQIGESAYRAQQAIERGEAVIVGVNKFAQAEGGRVMPIQRIAAAVEREQVARLQAFRAARDAGAVEARLADVRAAADGTANLMPAFVDAVDEGATLGEICDVLRSVFGTHVAREHIA
jgi:methylmalonyl-CoA mutase N-terminal domain/subunit